MVYRVGLPEVTPFFIETPAGISGVFYEIFENIIISAKVKVSSEILPYKRLFKEARSGQVDMLILPAVYPELRTNFIELGKIRTSSVVLVGIQPKLSFKKKRIIVGSLLGTRCFPLTDKKITNYELSSLASYTQAFELLKSGHIDTLCTTKESYEFELYQSKLPKIQLINYHEYEKHFDISLFVNKNLPKKNRQQLRTALRQVRDDSKVISTLYKKYHLTM